MAAIVWTPACGLLSTSLVAEPLTKVTAEPMGMPSISNSTVPVGCGSPLLNGLTTAVKVRAWP